MGSPRRVEGTSPMQFSRGGLQGALCLPEHPLSLLDEVSIPGLPLAEVCAAVHVESDLESRVQTPAVPHTAVLTASASLQEEWAPLPIRNNPHIRKRFVFLAGFPALASKPDHRRKTQERAQTSSRRVTHASLPFVPEVFARSPRFSCPSCLLQGRL